MRLAVVGVGGMGKGHVEHLRELPGADLLAVVDLDLERAKRVQTDFGIPRAYSDFEKMMDQEKPEAVFVCTPPFAHLPPVRAVAERGINVFVEKPLDCDVDRAKEMVRICRKAGITTQMGYHWRFNEGRVEARDLLLRKGGSIGLFEGKWWGGIYNVPWWIRREMSGGQITEQTTHIFDQARWLVGEVDSVQALLATRMNTMIEGYDIEDVSATLLKFKSGAVGVVTSTNASVRGEVGVKVVAEKLVYADYADRVELGWKDHAAVFRGSRNAYLAEEEAFISAAREGRASAVDLEEGLRSVELSLAAIKSSDEGRPVRLPL